MSTTLVLAAVMTDRIIPADIAKRLTLLNVAIGQLQTIKQELEMAINGPTADEYILAWDNGLGVHIDRVTGASSIVACYAATNIATRAERFDIFRNPKGVAARPIPRKTACEVELQQVSELMAHFDLKKAELHASLEAVDAVKQ